MHDPRKCLEGIFVGELCIRPWKWSKALMVPHENFVVIVLMVNRDVWLHDVEAVAVDSVDELQYFLVNKILDSTEANGTYCNTERPNIRRRSPG